MPTCSSLDPSALSRAQGCLLGQLAGDSLGSLVEFTSPEVIRRKYPDGVRILADGGRWETMAGQPTDDSEISRVITSSLPFLSLPKSRLWRYFADDR